MQEYVTRVVLCKTYKDFFSYSQFCQMCASGRGPPFYKIGRKRVYKTVDIEKWIESHKRDPSGQKLNADLGLCE